MSYLPHLQQSRWVQVWSCDTDGSYFSIRFRNSGTNECAVPSISEAEETSITKWFSQHNIERDATGTNLWWCMKKFTQRILISLGPDNICKGGIEFRISADAYKNLFRTPCQLSSGI